MTDVRVRELIRRLAVAALGAALLAPAAAEASQTAAGAQPPNPDALLLVDFQKRIDRYQDMHEEVDKGAARQQETENPAEIRQAQDVLAARIRAARPNARPGDIFTPEIGSLFRRLMYPEMRGAEGRETKREIKEDAPKSVPLKVNASYPEGAALPTVPGNVLVRLPQLPEDLEYRIIDRHLILRDVDANLIVDFIPNAIR